MKRGHRDLSCLRRCQKLKEGDFTYWDNSTPLKKTATLAEILSPVTVIKEGRLVTPADRRPSWAVRQRIGEGRPYRNVQA